MTLWFGVALMTAAAIFAVLWPLARQRRRFRSGSDVAVYRDQLDEIERDRAAGLIADKEAAAAQVEVSRRLIAAADAQTPAGAPATSATWRRRVVAIAALVVLPFGVGGFYLALGSPSLPDQPLAPRLAAARGTQSVDGLIAQVEAHLERNPDDGRGWEVIAPIYLRLGRFDDAVKARRNALRLNGETAEREAALGEALVFAANGVVTAEAKAAFERAVALDADERAGALLPRPCRRAGRRPHASRRDLARADRRRSPRCALARFRAPRARPGRGRHHAGGPSGGRSGSLSAGPSSGPSEEQVAASADLSPEQRKAMIRGMVERLSERLHRDGADVEGWLRLVRSYMVLGEPDKARAAVVRCAACARRRSRTSCGGSTISSKDLGLEG